MAFLCKKIFSYKEAINQNSEMHQQIHVLFKENVGHFIQLYHVKFDVSILPPTSYGRFGVYLFKNHMHVKTVQMFVLS